MRGDGAVKILCWGGCEEGVQKIVCNICIAKEIGFVQKVLS